MKNKFGVKKERSKFEGFVEKRAHVDPVFSKLMRDAADTEPDTDIWDGGGGWGEKQNSAW